MKRKKARKGEVKGKDVGTTRIDLYLNTWSGHGSEDGGEGLGRRRGKRRRVAEAMD